MNTLLGGARSASFVPLILPVGFDHPIPATPHKTIHPDNLAQEEGEPEQGRPEDAEPEQGKLEEGELEEGEPEDGDLEQGEPEEGEPEEGDLDDFE